MQIVIRIYNDIPVFCEYIGENTFDCWDYEMGLFYEMSLKEIKITTEECSKSIYYDWLDDYKEARGMSNIKIIKLATIERYKKIGII